MLRPYLHRLTKSEFHCLLVGGHATVAGFAFAIFVMFGVKSLNDILFMTEHYYSFTAVYNLPLKIFLKRR